MKIGYYTLDIHGYYCVIILCIDAGAALWEEVQELLMPIPIAFDGFVDFDLGFFDEGEGRVEPAENPFLTKVLPMSPTVRRCG